jgi:hypothetical protein
MWSLTGKVRWGAALIVATSVAALPVYALATADLEALAKLEHGLWQVRDLDSEAAPLAVCIGDPLILAQIEHQGIACAREVVESGPAGGTIRYTCPGRGFGHSTVKVETPRLAKVHTQGIKGNQPFDYRLEARRTGPC